MRASFEIEHFLRRHKRGGRSAPSCAERRKRELGTSSARAKKRTRSTAHARIGRKSTSAACAALKSASTITLLAVVSSGTRRKVHGGNITSFSNGDQVNRVAALGRSAASQLTSPAIGSGKFNDLFETQEAGERENGHAALGNSHAPSFRGGARDSASGTQQRWGVGFQP